MRPKPQSENLSCFSKMSEGAHDEALPAEAFRGDAKSLMEPNQIEIQRRSGIAQDAENLNQDVFQRVGDGQLAGPFVRPDQLWVLYSISHVYMSPVCKDPRNPGVRIYGVFETNEDARDHANLISAEDKCSLLISPTHEWIVGASQPDRYDQRIAAPHIEKLLDANLAKRASERTKFEENVSKKTVPYEGKKEDEDDQASGDAADGEELSEGMTRAKKLPRTLGVREQSYAVVSFLPDTTRSSPEFIFRVYACFEMQSDADRYVRNVAADHVKELDIDVVSLCEWLHPQTVQGKNLPKEVFRAGELDSIMSWHRSQPEEVDKFKRWRDEN